MVALNNFFYKKEKYSYLKNFKETIGIGHKNLLYIEIFCASNLLVEIGTIGLGCKCGLIYKAHFCTSILLGVVIKMYARVLG